MRVGVFGAGGPAGINVVRSLVEAGHKVLGMDANPLHLPWVEAYAEAMALPEPDINVINGLELDAVHSQSEEQVLWIAQNKMHLTPATLCPTASAVMLSQDKFEAALQFRRKGLREDRVHLVQDMIGVDDAINDLGLPMWMRARHGAGARGSALCESRVEATYWFQYWHARDPQLDFIAEAYLPGRDLAWTSLWKDGELIASFGRERIEYIYPRLAPSGRTGTPSIARTVHEEALNEAAQDAVWAIEEKPNGFYSVDLVEDAEGVPRPTEVNAGRCFTTSYLATAAGLNFMDLWCAMIKAEPPARLHRNDRAQRAPGSVRALNSIPAGLTWMRHIDCPELLLDGDGKVLPYFGMPQRRRTRQLPPRMQERAAMHGLEGRGRASRRRDAANATELP